MFSGARTVQGKMTSAHITRPEFMLMAIQAQRCWEASGRLTEEETLSRHKTAFHFYTICPNEFLGGVGGKKQGSCLHTVY